MALRVEDTPTFKKVVKKIHARDKEVVDKVVTEIAVDPAIGEEKKGDLAGVFVYKFKLNKQEVLLSYTLQPDKASPEVLVLLSLGSHENFYSDLKR